MGTTDLEKIKGFCCSLKFVAFCLLDCCSLPLLGFLDSLPLYWWWMSLQNKSSPLPESDSRVNLTSHNLCLKSCCPVLWSQLGLMSHVLFWCNAQCASKTCQRLVSVLQLHLFAHCCAVFAMNRNEGFGPWGYLLHGGSIQVVLKTTETSRPEQRWSESWWDWTLEKHLNVLIYAKMCVVLHWFYGHKQVKTEKIVQITAQVIKYSTGGFYKFMLLFNFLQNCCCWKLW